MTRARKAPERRGPGRPVTVGADEVLRLRIPAAEMAALRRAAGDGNVSAWVREAIRMRLDS